MRRLMFGKYVELLSQVVFSKKVRYSVYSVVLTLSLVLVSTLVTKERVLFNLFAGIFIFVFVGFVSAQITALPRLKEIGLTLILPLHLALGFITSYFYFPNLGGPLRVILFIAVGFLIYILYLINNVFLVIEERGSLIPLYNVALTWVQILIIVLSIPFLSGLYKIPVNFLYQNILVGGSAFLLCSYMIWCISYDPDIKQTALTEKLWIAAQMAFLVFSSSLAVSFFPSESFLRALFVCSVLLFCLSYIYAHYKNRLTVRLILDYSAISLIFLVILLVFKP